MDGHEPRLSPGWEVDPAHPDGVLVILTVGGRPVRFVADPVHAEGLGKALRQAARDRYDLEDED